MADAAGRPTTEHELTRHLAETLVQGEVMEPMDKIGWAFGTPPRPGQPDNPAPGAAPTAAAPDKPAETTPAAEGAPAPTNVPTATPEIDFEALKDPATGLYAGKYKTKDEVVKGMGHVVNMAKEAFARENAARQEAERLRSELANRQTQPAPAPGAAPASAPISVASRATADEAQAIVDKVLSEIAENGGVLDEDAAKRLQKGLRESVSASARAAAEEALAARQSAQDKDANEWAAVDKFMKDKYPDAEKFADEIGLFVQTNPLISKAVNALATGGDRIAASELAYLEFKKVQDTTAVRDAKVAAETKEIQLEAADQVRKEAVDAARKDAGIMASAAGGVHEVRSTAPARGELEEAAAGMRAYGMQPGNPAAAKWRQLVIGPSLDPKVFGE